MNSTTRLLLAWAATSIAEAATPSGAPVPKAGLDETVIAIQRLREPPNDIFTSRAIKDYATRRLLHRLDQPHLAEAARKLVGKFDMHQGLDFEILLEWVRLDPKAAFEYLRDFDPKWFDCVLGNELFERWAGIDANAALAAARSINNKERVCDVLAVIAVDSPPQALEQMPSLQSPQYGFARDVLAYWAARNSEEATKWVLAQPKRNSLLWNLAFVRAELDRTKTEQWASGLGGDDRIHALTGMISESVTDRVGKTQDVETASKEFLRFFPNSELNQDNLGSQDEKSLAGAIADAWAKSGRFLDGVKWILLLKDSDGRNEIHAQFAAIWSEKNPADVLKYLSGLSTGPELDRALGYSATNLARIDPALVFRLAQSTGENEWRHTTMVQCFRLWFHISPRDAISALDSLPKDEAKKIESTISESAKAPPRRTF